MYNFPFQLAHVHPTNTPVPVGAASPSPGHATLMMTVEIAQMNLIPVVSLYCSFILLLFLEYHIFLYKYFLNTLLFCSLSAAYPTCFPLTQFTCANGRCININWRCDNGEYHPSLPHLSRCTVESNLKILRVCADVQTMTVETAATKQAAATLVPVSSSNVTAAAASQNTGPATATMTVETTVTRLMPTVPTKVI